MRASWKITAAVAALALAVPVWAQFGPRTPGINGVFHPVVGQGAAYEMKGHDSGVKEMEIAVVGKEDYQGQTGYWLETSFQGSEHGPGAVKMLMVMEGANPGAKRMIMMMNGQAYEFPMNNPMMGSRMAQSAPHDIRTDKSIARVGTETITVPAGTFSCEHYRATDGSSEFWISDKVSPWGLVKSVSKENTMILTRQITDAKSKITGPVKPFNPMEMMQQQHP
ncbi:MAG TPA: DUF4412 domain-containing protein [Candidatus Acidoferrales bacterium]|nr:DUF4412 domain-containing protein [Candidatus Acidoferrales bacterium]